MTVFKLSGGGNDFIALVEPDQWPSADVIRSWCRRGTSLGADGLMILERHADRPSMAHFNSDGQRSSLCLNGCRCAVRLAFHLGWAANRLILSTDSGQLAALSDGDDHIRVDVPPIVSQPRLLAVDIDWIDVRLEDQHLLEGWRVDVGVPHFVVPWPSLAAAPVEDLGRRLRHHHAMGSTGANVNFVRSIDEHSFEIRTYERGVEAETLACGTGVIAAAVSLAATTNLELPVSAQTAGGARFVVSQAAGGGCFRLAGDARLVARCELLSGAEPAFGECAWKD